MVLMFFIFAFAIFFAAVMAGCAGKSEVITQYKYIEADCAQPVIAPVRWLETRWIAIDINNTRYYATPDGASLLANLRKCE